MKPIELKEGNVILYKGDTYKITEFSNIPKGTSPRILGAIVIMIKCPKCGGNLKKMGKIKNQYSCMDCNKLVFMED